MTHERSRAGVSTCHRGRLARVLNTRRKTRHAAVFLLAASVAAAPLPGADPAAGRALRFFEEKVRADPDDFLAWNQLASRHLQLGRETGDPAHLPLAARAAGQSLKAMPAAQNPGGLGLLARAQLAQHRFAEAHASALQLVKLTPGKAATLLILGDACMELGDYPAAAEAYARAVTAQGAALETESRLARLDLVHGRIDRARQRFEAALQQARELPAPSPETVAWCEVQLGELAFKCGDWPTAEAHYRAALGALPEHWGALDHLAELQAARGENEAAIATYTGLIERVPRFELMQALGDLFLFLQRPDEARPWLDRAREGYEESIAAGEVQYLHHLAGFYCDSQPDPKKAVELARKDLEGRKTIQAHDALAWALYKDGQVEAAAKEIAEALRTGTKDAHLLQHAGLIRMSAGDLAGGRAALKQALAVNPRHQAFHAHR